MFNRCWNEHVNKKKGNTYEHPIEASSYQVCLHNYGERDNDTLPRDAELFSCELYNTTHVKPNSSYFPVRTTHLFYSVWEFERFSLPMSITRCQMVTRLQRLQKSNARYSFILVFHYVESHSRSTFF